MGVNQSLSIFLALLGFGLFSVGDALKKYLLIDYTVTETQVMTLFSAVIFCFVFVKALGGAKSVFKINRPWLHFWKTVCVVLTITCALKWLETLSLDVFYIIIFTAPLITSFMAMIIYKERVSKTKLMLICLGFLGVVIIAIPDADVEISYMGVIYTLLLAFFFASNSILNKAFSEDDPKFPFLFLPSLAAAILFFAINNFSYPDVTMEAFLISILSGFGSTAGMLFLLKAFQIGEASSVANYHYSQMIWAIVLGYFLFDVYPQPIVLFGGAIIISSGLLLYFYDHRKNKKQRAKKAA